MSLMLYRLGRLAVRRRRAFLATWLAIAAVSVSLAASGIGGVAQDWTVPGTESQQALDLLRERFPEASGATARLVVKDPGGDVSRREAEVTAVVADAQGADGVLAALSPFADPTKISADRSTAIIDVIFVEPASEVGDAGFEALLDVAERARNQNLVAEVGGEIALFVETSTVESGPAEAAGLLAAVIILLSAFGSVVAMGLPIGIALLGVTISISLFTVIGAFATVAPTAVTVTTMVGIGVGIDYALFIVTRYRQHLNERMTVEESVARAIATAGQAVVFAGGTVVIAILGLGFTGIPVLFVMGIGASLGVLVMVLASITLLPALLGFSGHAINRLRFSFQRKSAETEAAQTRRWDRWGTHVTSHPWRYLIVSLALLLGLAAPLTQMRMGQADASVYPTDYSSRRAFDLITDSFDPGFDGPLLISVDLTEAPDGPATMTGLASALAGVPNVAAVGAPVVNAAGDTGIVVVTPASAPQAAETNTLVSSIRSTVIPAALAGTGAEAFVGGPTAFFIDLTDQIGARLPIFIGSVIALSVLLLTMVFRSILVPLKAAAMNLLSIGAAYGVVVAVFQWGWGVSVLGLSGPIPIVPSIPMFLFAILFGLSMDYEVFLLSRVREEYLATGDNTGSVISGISATARVITSAALIMVAVFGGFIMNVDPFVKIFGLGMATAILIDATIVRMMLVPASMQLMGKANWWLPRFLDRALPNIDIEGEGGLPEPAFEPIAPRPEPEQLLPA